MMSSSSTNGLTGPDNATSDVSPSTYQMLLKQVESLRKENSTLKAELKNNTSHISKLEDEALRMKDMVLMLGNPSLAGGNLETDVLVNFNGIPESVSEDTSGLPEGLASMSLHGQTHQPAPQPPISLKLQNGNIQDKKQRPEFISGLSQNSSFNNNFSHSSTSSQGGLRETVSPSSTSAVADALKRTLWLYKNERERIVRYLEQEEKIKDRYLKQFKELTSRLDNVSDSDKFTKPNDKMRNEVENEIRNLTETMKQNLGSTEIMQERLETRLKQLQFIEKEIATVTNHINKLEKTPTSPEASTLTRLHQGGIDPVSFVSHSGTGPDGLWTQTPKLASPLENMMYEEEFSTSDNQNLDFASGSGKMSRTVQTATSCLAGRYTHNKKALESPTSGMLLRDASVGRNDLKTPGSIESLPSQSDKDDTSSMKSFTTSLPRHFPSSCSANKDGTHSPSFLHKNKEELYHKFLKRSKSLEGCASMRQSGCIHLIVQIIHDGSMLSLPPCWSVPASPGRLSSNVKNALKMAKDIRIGMSQVLRNIAHVTPDSTTSKVENQILQNLENIRDYCEYLFDFWVHAQTLQNKPSHSKGHKLSSPPVIQNGVVESSNSSIDGIDKSSENVKSHDFQSGLLKIYDPPMLHVNAVMKLSHNEEMRSVINDFGGLLAVAELFVLHCRCVATIEMVQAFVGNEIVKPDEKIINQLQLLKKFIGYALINLTYKDMSNKAALIQMPGLVDAVMSQMELDSEEMQKDMAQFMRNLSCQPDEKCREILKQKKIVTVLMKCALRSKHEETLKSVLGALWNLSGHCAENRANICAVKGALGFLVSTLTYKTIAIIESGGAILRNVSSVVATNEEYRQILREKNCLQILLTHLRAASLTIVSNACGTLWNLSAKDSKDQQMLLDFGAVPMLRNLVDSRHDAIARGSRAALRNLLMKKENISSMNDADKIGVLSNSIPRHNALSSTLMSARSTTHPQRHSLQETTSSSPIPDVERAKRFQKGGLHYSGSLGSLPSSDFNDNLSNIHGNAKYVPNARNSNSYHEQHSSNGLVHRNLLGQSLGQHKTGMNPIGFSRISDRGGLLKDVLMSNDTASPTNQIPIQKPMTLPIQDSPLQNMSIKECFQIISGKSPLSLPNATVLNGVKTNDFGIRTNVHQHLSSPRNSRGSNSSNPYLSGGPSLAWQNTDSSSFEPSGVPTKMALNMTKHTPVAQTQRAPKLLVPKNPEDLARRLHHVEEVYGYDDDTTNYSLQYRDEHMTPGIQSPRTEEIYEIDSDAAGGIQHRPPDLAKEYMHSQISGSIIPSSSMNGRAPKSDGGLSGLSSCVGSTGSSATRQDKIAGRMGDAPPIGDRVSSSLIKSMTERYTNDQSHIAPSYNLQYDDGLAFEDEKPKNFGAIYSEEQLFEHVPTKSYSKMEPAPLSPETNKDGDSVNSLKLANVTTYNASGAFQQSAADSEAAVLESRELEDKFDSGALTPAHYSAYKSGCNSGIITPNYVNETPLMFSRCSSPGTVSDDGVSIHSSRTSEPESRMMSGRVSPSHLPDSPSMSMPVSPRRSPPPQLNISESHNIELSNGQINSKTSMDGDPQKRSQMTSEVVNSLHFNENRVSNSALPSKIEANLKKFEQPGYFSSMPHKDELNTFNYEGAMSTMTKFSALTIDGSDKVQPMQSNQSAISSLQSPDKSKASLSGQVSGEKSKASGDLKRVGETAGNGDVMQRNEFSHPGQRAVLHAGYVTSLPTNDEIKKFVNEGTLSPMTVFSEISCIKNDNDGFQKSTGSVFSVPNTRSSATGASVPPPAPDKIQENVATAIAEVKVTDSENQDEPKVASNLSSVTSPTTHSIDDAEEEFDDDSCSLPSSSSDDEDLLQKCIQIGQRGLPKKKNFGRGLSSKSSARSTSSKSSTKSVKSSRSKEKVTTVSNGDSRKEEDRSVTNPSPEVVSEKPRPSFNVKQKIAAANMKLKGQPISEYIDNLMKKSNGNDIEDEDLKPENAAVARMKKVIDNTELLQQSYSVRKKLKEQEKHAIKVSESKQQEPQNTVVSMPKTTGLLPSEPAALLQSKMRIQSYMREGITTYATEGTPIEMSRSTSLSNLTIDSDALDNAGMTTVQKQLKTSYSVPDIQSSSEIPVSAPRAEESQSVVNVSSHARSLSLGGSAAMSKDSREILETLGQQIASLSLTTAESVITNKDPGYTTSLPHTDEIRRYEAEGSQCGGTVFSALTIDSDTKIAPTFPTDISQNTVPQENKIGQVNKVDQIVSSQHCASATQNSVSINSLASVQASYVQHEGLVYESQSSSNDVTAILNNHDQSSWPPQIMESQYASHYNNDNDNLAMREERRNYTIEDTPLNMSGHGSLSSLSLDSIDDDNDLLKECIKSALPSDRNLIGTGFPNQMMQHVTGSPARYNQGAPDGKVDASASQQAPFVVPNAMQKRISEDAQYADNSSMMTPYMQSPNDELWSMFQRNANDVATQLMQGHGNASGMLASSQSPDMQPSSSISLSQPTDGFYRLSRQASMQESDLSVSSSIFDEQHGHAKGSYKSAPQPRSQSRSRKYSDKSTDRTCRTDRALKSVNKPSPMKGKDVYNAGRSAHLSARTRGSSSSSSSPYRKQQKQYGSSNKSSDLCGCQVACSRPSAHSRSFDHGPVSASTSHLVDGIKSPARRRRQSTNSASKYSFNHQPKPNRTRNSVKNIYRPSVTQIYPPLKDMVGVLEGVASVAARGDKVVADRNPTHSTTNYGSQSLSKKSSSSSLVRSATFITEKPSSILLDSMTQEEKARYASKSNSSMSSLTQSQHSSHSAGKTQNKTASPRSSSRSLTTSRISSQRGSTHSLKENLVVNKNSPKVKTKKKNAPTDQTKSKQNKVWSGIKKLLSPSEDTVKPSGKNLPSKKTTPQSPRVKKESKKTEKAVKVNNKSLSSKNMNTRMIVTSPQLPVNKKSEASGSSLSLSSSSGSNISVSDIDIEKSSVLINNNVTPYGLLPKSPSVNAISRRTISMIPQSHSASVLEQSKTQNANPTVWRRTPPQTVEADAKASSEKSFTRNNSEQNHVRSETASSNFAAVNGSNSVRKAQDIWVSKKDALLMNDSYQSSKPAMSLHTDNTSNSEDRCFESVDETSWRTTSNSLNPGFHSPPRTQSPRVVQQVAPFNYKPSPSKVTQLQQNEKNICASKRISPDCKHTPV